MTPSLRWIQYQLLLLFSIFIRLRFKGIQAARFIFYFLPQVWCVESEEQQYQNWTVNSSQKQLDISALKPGKQYWITIAAVNGAGVGTPSDPHGFLISELHNKSSIIAVMSPQLRRDLQWSLCFVFRLSENWFPSVRPHRRSDSASGPAIDWQYWRPPVVQFNGCSGLCVPAPRQERAPHQAWACQRWARPNLTLV